jgi:hypothetical protein
LRPLTGFTHHLDERLWPSRPWLMHAHSVAWLALAVFGAGLVFRRRVTPPGAAGLATLLYAIADVHATAVGWLSNRNAVIACALGVLAIVFHDRFRRGGFRAGAVLAPLLLLAALLAGELALGAAGYSARCSAGQCSIDGSATARAARAPTSTRSVRRASSSKRALIGCRSCSAARSAPPPIPWR